MVSAFELKHYFSIANPRLIVMDPALKTRAEEALSTMDAIGKLPLIDLGGSSARSVITAPKYSWIVILM